MVWWWFQGLWWWWVQFFLNCFEFFIMGCLVWLFLFLVFSRCFIFRGSGLVWVLVVCLLLIVLFCIIMRRMRRMMRFMILWWRSSMVRCILRFLVVMQCKRSLSQCCWRVVFVFLFVVILWFCLLVLLVRLDIVVILSFIWRGILEKSWSWWQVLGFILYVVS